MGFFSRIWIGITQLFGLILPFLSRATDFRSWGPGLKWAVRILLLLVILVLLWFINNKVFDPTRLLGFGPPKLHQFWLPILFLLFVCLSWLGWWLWKLLTPEVESSEYPDIDAAWDEARAALNAAGIDLTEAPLFFVLGRPAGPEEALLTAAQVALTVRQVPRRPEAPLHVYAHRDAIYVTCAGASLLGRQAAILAGEEDALPGADAATPAVSRLGSDLDDKSININEMIKTMGSQGGGLKEVHEILTRAQKEGRLPTAAEKKRMRQLSGVPRPSLLKNAAEAERLSGRLRHLCRLIVRDRRPFCPVNGVLVLVPLAATDTEEDANQTAQICQQDLLTTRRAFQVHCPHIALVCDLETAPGFREFFERFPEKQRARRVGQRFPLVPAVPPAEVAGLIESGVQWLGQTLFPTWVYKFFRVEGPGREGTAADHIRANAQLYKLMYEMGQRQKLLARILARGLPLDQPGPLLFGGCYVAATGPDAAREQAFAAGVFRRLVDEQNFVSWTQEALDEEAEYERWSKIGYAAVGVCAVLLLVLGYFWVKGAG
jgi:hypothetical protein